MLRLDFLESRLGFLKKFFAKNIALSVEEDKISGPLNRGGITDLALLWTLSAIGQKSLQPSLSEVVDSFVV